MKKLIKNIITTALFLILLFRPFDVGAQEYFSEISTGREVVLQTEAELTEAELLTEMYDLLPISQPGFTINFDFESDRFLVTFSDTEPETVNSFYDWLADSGYADLPVDNFEIDLPAYAMLAGVNVLCNGGTGIYTAIGCIPVTDVNAFGIFVVTWGMSIAGGVAFLLIVYAGFLITTSSGKPERLKAGQQLIISAITGLLLVIFAAFIMRLIGRNILGIL